LFASKNNITEQNITGAYLIMLVYRCLFTKTLTWQSSLHGKAAVLLQTTIEKHLKSICSSMLSCCFEADNVEKYMQIH